MFDSTGFIKVAEKLALWDDEASRRTAISRAYYCVFHMACLLVERGGILLPNDGRAFRDVWEVLRRQGGARVRAGIDGLELLDRRREADYAREHVASCEETEEALRLAQCCGNNTYSRLGNGEMTYSAEPVSVIGFPQGLFCTGMRLFR